MRRPMLDQLSETLDELTTPKLGLVLTGVSLDATFTYGYYSAATRTEAQEVAAPEAPAPAKIEGRWSSVS